MSCVGASLESAYNRVVSGKHIHNFALAFVSPLKAQYNINFHIVFVLIAIKIKFRMEGRWIRYH